MTTQEDRERAINILSAFALEQAFNEWAEENWDNHPSQINQSDWETILENVFIGNPFSLNDYENAVEALNTTEQDWGEDA